MTAAPPEGGAASWVPSQLRVISMRFGSVPA
jgi:hypothetical protein